MKVNFQELPKDIQDGFLTELKKRGYDPKTISELNISAEEEGGQFHISWQGVSVSFPAPSKSTWNEFFKTYAPVIVGALIALAGAAAGASMKNSDK